MVAYGHRSWPLPTAILALGALLRWPGFSGKTLWYDEAYSVFFASHPLGEIIRLSGYDTTPGLFAVLLSLWSRLAGTGTAALTALPFLLSIASLAVVFLIGRELAGRRAGLIAALLVAINPLHIRYAAEIRAYSLTFLLAALSVFFLLRLIERGAAADGFGWTASIALGLYGHYTFFFVVILEAALLAAWAVRYPARRRLVISLTAAAAAAYVPQLALFRRWESLLPGDGAASYFQRGFGHGDAGTVLTYFATLILGERRFYPLSTAGALLTATAGSLVIVAVIYGLAKGEGRRAKGEGRPIQRRTVMVLGAMPFAGIALLMAARFIHAPRYYLVFVLPLALFAAILLSMLTVRRQAAALTVIAALSLLPAISAGRPAPATAFTYYGKPFAETVARESRPGDLVLTDHFTDILFRRYPAGPAETRLFFPKEGRNVTDLAERFGWCDFNYLAERDLGTLAALTDGRQRVWTVDYLPQRTSIQDPTGIKRRWLEEHFRLARSVEFPADAPPGAQKAVLLLYERP